MELEELKALAAEIKTNLALYPLDHPDSVKGTRQRNRYLKEIERIENEQARRMARKTDNVDRK